MLNDFSIQLAQIRKASGLSQAKLAELAGVKQSNVARIENGSSVPTLSTMQKILKPLGCSLAIMKNQDKRVLDSAPEIEPDEEVKKLLRENTN